MPTNKDGPEITQNQISQQQVPSIRALEGVPVIYADGIFNQVRALGVSKMHFFRDDAVLGDVSSYTKVEVLQLIIPAVGFTEMVAFLEHRLKLMIEKGQASQQDYDTRKKFYETQRVGPHD